MWMLRAVTQVVRSGNTGPNTSELTLEPYDRVRDP